MFRNLHRRYEHIMDIRLFDPLRRLPSQFSGPLAKLGMDNLEYNPYSSHICYDIAEVDKHGEQGTGIRHGRNKNMVFIPDDFFHEMAQHRIEISKCLDTVWRDGDVSEILERLSDFNFFVDNAENHNTSPLHKILRKCDIVLGSQLRAFCDASIKHWVDLIKSFLPSSGSKPAPFLSLKLTIKDGHVVLQPTPEQFIQRVHEMMNGAVSVAHRLKIVETELVPFCDLGTSPMFNMTSRYPLLQDAKNQVADYLHELFQGPINVLDQFRQYAHLLDEPVWQDQDYAADPYCGLENEV